MSGSDEDFPTVQLSHSLNRQSSTPSLQMVTSNITFLNLCRNCRHQPKGPQKCRLNLRFYKSGNWYELPVSNTTTSNSRISYFYSFVFKCISNYMLTRMHFSRMCTTHFGGHRQMSVLGVYLDHTPLP